MSHHDSNEISAAFLDVAAYFSEDEWKLLHEWQKELYKNVMKEIHQALISLGPLIATTVFSLQAKGKEGLCPVGNRDSERRNSVHCFPSDNIANPERLFRVNKEEILHPKIPQDSERRESIECLNPGFPFLKTEMCLREEEKPVSMFIDHLGLEVGESSTHPNSGHEVVSFRFKDEEDAYCMDHHDSERIESMTSLTGDGTINRKQKVFDFVKRTEKETPCKASPRKAKVKVVQSYEKGTHSRRQLSAVNREQGEEETTQCESGFSDPAPFSVHQGVPKVERSETYNDCGSLANLLTCQPNIQTTLSVYSCTECEKTFSNKECLNEHRREHMAVRPYQCIECNRSFNRKDNLFIHMRTHTGERPYQCVMCGKSFSQHGVLNRHLRTHMSVQT